ncbi:DUF4259 domain-containing protein [Erythrobacter sp. JK5]|uniref:DUF4259 domain-containing protein n=1 Tax=Erythrobacter sp. JK5 TaxID=2829500 RepID=UPI001BADF111|nr:DUF4259 domain-containing protein [Erythrobacter sp. JK5]QUL37136.1 DUF4259 domain-containing protein [Erythrobacter sp. JK5]
MGAWGTGPFENDSALDFVHEVNGADVLVRAFEAANTDYIDVDEASAIVVAAECVAALKGFAHPDLPEDLAAQIAGFAEPDAELIALARGSLEAVMDDSELVELWNEGEPNEESNRFHAEMAGLAERLAKAAGP